MAESLKSQAERLYRALNELARYYQFRNKEAICCHGVSPTQCYTLEMLSSKGPLPMNEVADHLGVDVSSMTRAVDRLVDRKYVRRRSDPDDRRKCLIDLTEKGRTHLDTIRSDVVERELVVLRTIDSASRSEVVRAVELLACSIASSDCGSPR